MVNIMGPLLKSGEPNVLGWGAAAPVWSAGGGGVGRVGARGGRCVVAGRRRGVLESWSPITKGRAERRRRSNRAWSRIAGLLSPVRWDCVRAVGRVAGTSWITLRMRLIIAAIFWTGREAQGQRECGGWC